MRGRIGKVALFLAIIAAITAFFLLGLGQHLTLENLKGQQSMLADLLASNPALLIAAFFVIYVAVTALSLPGAAILTLAAGAIFGLVLGTLIVSFASVIGATLAFLSSRYLLRDWVSAKFPKAANAINEGVLRDGSFYLLTLRLIPIFPFFLINLVMGLTRMRVAVFFAVSQVGMLAGTLVFVNAGTQIAAIEKAGDVLSPGLIGSLVLLGVFPLLAKAAISWWQRRKVYAGWKRPRQFDRNLIVIGAGAGGLVTSFIAATVKAKVTLIEKGKMGGDCLNTGCVPSKAIIRSARLAHEMRHADEFGLVPSHAPVPFDRVMARIRETIRIIEPADSVERYTGLGVDVRQGHATLVDPWTVEIDGGERLTARAIVIAAGGEPAVPDIPGLKESRYLTSDTLWDALADRKAAPERLVVIGGGPIGTELAQAFARLGSKVVQVEAGDRILPREDVEVSEFIGEALRGEGVDLKLRHNVLRVEGGAVICGHADGEVSIPFDELIVAVGRSARLHGYGLERLGVDVSRTIEVDPFLRTNLPNIFAVGDVAGPYQFTHAAAHQAWFAAVNALFGGFRKFRVDYSVLPWATYTDPEVARVGHSELSAREASVAYEVVRYDLGHLDRAVAEGANKGFVKLLVAPGRDRILGATIVAHAAGEMIAEIVLAMKHGIGLNKILGTIKAYPTMAEANKYAAGEWKKARKPERLLRLVERYHDWMRR
jgi:pyruvate/2-oxoglutarate dehydrogenase complex dihydrolipoamide dehydrogenase (E3) component/uncharacterized membrane protein YdjX (TVP38/TMEM64 family)